MDVAPSDRMKLLGLARSPRCLVSSLDAACTSLLCVKTLFFVCILLRLNLTSVYSTDGGVTWTTLETYVWKALWASKTPGRIYYSHWKDKRGSVNRKSRASLVFATSDSLLASSTERYGNAADFLVAQPDSSSEILWIGVVTSRGLLLIASRDEGVTYRPVTFPTTRSEPQTYELLDATLGTTFVSVRFLSNVNVADLFAADLTDGAFEPVLVNQSTSVAFGAVWEEVESMPGTYLTAQRFDTLERTRITHDMGASWAPLPAVTPACAASPQCAVRETLLSPLSQALTSSCVQLQLLFASHISAGAVRSVPSALGLVVGMGHEATQIAQPVTPSLYVSTNGGYTWQHSRTGEHVFEIAGAGGLVVAADVSSVETNTLHFSTGREREREGL